MTRISNYARPGSGAVAAPGTPGSTGGTLGTVTDGTTTVSPVSELDFTSGAVVADLGSGVAGVVIAIPAFATPAIVLGTAAAAGSAPTVIRSDSTIVAFDGTVPTDVAAAAAVGSAAIAARRDHAHGGLGKPLGLTGATAATRYVGATASGAPVSGTFAVGDFIVDQSGKLWVCTVAGSPGTWVQVGGASGDTSGQFVVGFDGGGGTPLAGKTADIIAPFTGTITGWTMLGDVSGSAVIDVWKTTYAGGPPTVSNTLINTGAGGVKPTLSSAISAQSASVAHWTTAVTAGDWLRFHLDSASSLGAVELTIAYSRP